MVASPRFSSLCGLLAICVLASSTRGSFAADRAPRNAEPSTSAAQAKAAERLASLPLSFEANRGQAAKGFAFLARGKGYNLYLTPASLELALRSPRATAALPHSAPSTGSRQAGSASSTNRTVIRMALAGARSDASMAGGSRLPGRVNYFLGRDPANWRTDVPTFARVRASEVYPGIDLVYYGNQGQLEYDLVVAPHADPSQIRMQFTDADRLAVTASGDLAISSRGIEIAFHEPSVYQQIDGRRRKVHGRFVALAGNSAGFALGAYDHSRPLVIDPTLDYATYLGGSGFPGDEGDAIAVDAKGDAYITGASDSADFPITQGAYQTINAAAGYEGDVVFVTKLNSTGTALVYSTFIGGTGGDHVKAIALDGSGNAYVAGYTYSTDFPTTMGAYETADAGKQTSVTNGFVSKLSADGSTLDYSTYLGGTGAISVFGDEAHAIAVDGNGDAYVAGMAYSSDFPVTTGAFQTTNKATKTGSNAFVTELNPAGSDLVYSTYIGGSGTFDVGDSADAVAVDSHGNAYVTGYTYSANFPTTTGALQTVNKDAAKGGYTVFVSKVSQGGAKLAYSTYLGGSGIATYGDRAFAIAIDGAGDAFVAGHTYSIDFPVTAGSVQTRNNAGNNGSTNAFLTKLNPSGSGLVYSTYLGGGGLYEAVGDAATGVGIDGSGNAYLSGSANSADFPVTTNALQSVNRAAHFANPNAFIAQFSAAGDRLFFSSYLGGSGYDGLNGMATDGLGSVYITGISYSTDFPVTKGAYQAKNNGETGVNAGTNAFVAKVSLGVPPATVPTTATLIASANPQIAPASVTFTAIVKPQSGTSFPSGNVAFSVDGVLKARVALGLYKAEYSTSALTAGTHTVKAYYAGDADFSASSATLTETIKTRTPMPKFSPASGSYTTAESIKLTDAAAGAAIHFTTNGATPTAASTRYIAAINITKSTTIKAIALAPGHAVSLVATADYIVKLPAPAPTFSPVAGAYNLPLTVKIVDKPLAGLAIYYTTNGTTPTLASTKCTAAGIKVSAKETIKAIAIATGRSKSAVVSASYTSK